MRALATPAGDVVLQRLAQAHERQRLIAVRESLADLLSAFHWCSAPYTEGDNRDYVASCRKSWDLMHEFVFGVFDRTGRFVGEAAIDDLDLAAGSANLSYWIAPSARRRGHGAKAAAVAARFAFRDLGLRELRLLVAPGNVASKRIASKLSGTPAPATSIAAPETAPSREDLRFVLDASHDTEVLRRDPASFPYQGISQGG